ncbi:ufm1-specific protease-like [Diaphorina citri]|uniref:Ufm1-specific protease-like n=1 Tax=Diaphorina citri TaxID=121845 RepID=A0A3Q0JCV0_DIACI|nr:ufm1-specific protease-like [Diaphorina citri]
MRGARLGGGVLAHTILGVDYDKENDVAKFLVLDPHYPGEENISVIQSKGWCGWKTANFWKKGTFYNMCLPMKKSCVRYLYNRYFSSIADITNTVLDILNQRVFPHLSKPYEHWNIGPESHLVQHNPLFLQMTSPRWQDTYVLPFSEIIDWKRAALVIPEAEISSVVDVVKDMSEKHIGELRDQLRFFHYRQQGETDDGWGCAYRSLQTLYSWFLLEGFTSKPVPTIREIQETLVYIQDKPPKFLGSRDWIGSTEVSFVLDTLLGVTSRILSVAANETLLSRVHELSRHFETHGTPVMIGEYGTLCHSNLE